MVKRIERMGAIFEVADTNGEITVCEIKLLIKLLKLVTPRGRCSLEKSSVLQTASSVSPYRSISETISST